MDKDPIVEVCHGPRCSDYGGKTLLKELRKACVKANMSTCQSLCTYSPVVRIDSKHLLNADIETVIRQAGEPTSR